MRIHSVHIAFLSSKIIIEEYITCTGKFESPKEGEDIEVRGRYVEHEKYGRQFDANSVEN